MVDERLFLLVLGYALGVTIAYLLAGLRPAARPPQTIMLQSEPVEQSGCLMVPLLVIGAAMLIMLFVMRT